MKKFIVILLSFIIFSHTPCFATTEQELFDNGVQLFNKGQYDKAIKQFSELIEISPNNADAYNNRGVSYIRLKQFDLAVKDFEMVKTIMPDLKGLHSNIGTAMYYKEEYGKALLNYDIEIAQEPDNYLAYFNRALCLLRLGKEDEALKSTDKAIELKTDFYWAHCFKGDILVRQGNIGTAIESYEDAVHLNPDTAYAKDMLAKLSSQNTAKTAPEPASQKSEKLSPQKAAKHTAPPPERILSTGTADNKTLSVQIGAYLKKIHAEEMKTKLIENGFDAQILMLKDSKGKLWYLVRYGQYAGSSEAKQAAEEIKEKLGIEAAVCPIDTW